MSGLEEAKRFYLEAGAPMLQEQFGDFVECIAVGLVGHGSECFGYDDALSRDHDFETGFCMWLTKDDEDKIGFALMRAYDKLKKEYCGAKLEHSSVMGQGAQGVFTIEQFYKKYTGTNGAPKRWQDWLYTESAFFAEATNGEVWRDDLGEFSKIRNEILTGMPEDVRLKKLASCCVRMAQTGQYNFARCLRHGEQGAAMIALGEFVKTACEMIFLLNRKHCPYYKWTFRALRDLPLLGDMCAPLEFLLTADNDNVKVKMEIVEDIVSKIIEELKAQNLANCPDNYLEPFGIELQRKIKNAEIRNLHVLIG